MLVFNAKFNGITFDGEKYMRDLDRAIRKVMREAARAWLIAVLNSIKSAGTERGDPYVISDKFPIVTGEAKGSLIPLGRALRVDVPVRPRPGKENRIAKGMAQGRYNYSREAPGAGGVHDTYFFNFQTDVEHYLTNERLDVTKEKGLRSKTPWATFPAGDKAFKEVMDKLKQHVPRVTDYSDVDSKSFIV